MGIQIVKKDLAEYVKKRQEEIARVKGIQSKIREATKESVNTSGTKTASLPR